MWLCRNTGGLSPAYIPENREGSRGGARAMSRPAPKKVPKKPTRARGTKHYAQLKSNKKNLVVFFGTFLGAGRDVPGAVGRSRGIPWLPLPW
jgi:hypothetical protein